MNRNTLLCALPLLVSGIGLPVMAADIDIDDIQQEVDTGQDQVPVSKPWKVRAGLLIETENKEGQSFDKDGFFEPTLWMDFSRDRWTFYGSYGRCEQVPDMRSCLSSGAMEQGSS